MTKISTEKELLILCNRNRDGSFSTQAARRNVLSMAARQLVTLGFYNLPARGLKQKHISALLALWKESGCSDATLKNRMSHMRWWTEKIDKKNLIPRANSDLGIGRRRYVTNKNKAVSFGDDALLRIQDPRVQLSLELQRAFGLRREESIKFQATFAYSPGSAYIKLKASWCKGGRERTVPITNEYQREILNRVALFTGGGSLIPQRQQYKEQLKRYENETRKAGLHKLHGLRHAYAQARYVELAGWQPPVNGGPRHRQLTPEMKKKDHEIRLLISEELGHSREEITAVYLGR
ncbi:integrase domain-containing protein [Herbaspirillum sp. CAH-3]|uniref:integrase domain-containing protein n=1 Tax=Herbaspirillum sp. CAH-3 TaxID=2605746 RepID=UPI0012ACD87F|nr:integrase domain-containing protein [Herbaspirillum sp. CAH-3]MRT30028.1 integrase [Herbaspirillum sp. CAH-3]